MNINQGKNSGTSKGIPEPGEQIEQLFALGS